MSDPFDTAGIRDRVLAGWVAAPVRLREDANAEEDLALGGYRDRLVIELAQNAADAAARAGVPGHLSLTLREQADGPPVLVAANTGQPLTAQGVQSLATLRASAKDGADVGRFGVGFASVLAVTDEPAVLSVTGGVRFSRADTVDAVSAAHSPALAAEVRRRDGHVPVLRLPFDAEGTPPTGFATAVMLPLRDEATADLVRGQLSAVDDALLLALPALQRIDIDVDGTRTEHRDAADRWHVKRRIGVWSDADRDRLLVDRPTEERRQSGWQVLWALPRNSSVTIPPFVHAPTPTDEPLSLPALLMAGFPLDPTRRHVAQGPLTERLVNEAAHAYVELVAARVAEGADVAPLVPVGLAAGALDGALREAVVQLLPAVPILRGVEHPDQPLRPRDAVALDLGADDPAVLAVVAPLVAGLVARPRSAAAAFTTMGVGTLALADVVDALPTTGEPAQWRERYAGLASLADDPNAREVLASIPVPLADGRVVRGVRGVLLPTDDRIPVAALATLAPYGLRVVHPAAAHPLLARLGATTATARAVLEHPAVAGAVEQSLQDEGDDGGGDDVAEAVLGLVAVALQDDASVPGSWADGDLGWLTGLALTDADGEVAAAGELVLPGSAAQALLDEREVGVVADQLHQAWSSEVLVAVGVLDDLGSLRVRDVELDGLPDDVLDLDRVDEWVDEVVDELGPGSVAELTLVRDLDLIRGDAWPEALRHMASRPALRQALVEPVRVTAPHGGARVLLSYTAWWLRRRLGTAGLLDPGAATGLAALLDEAPAWLGELDEGVRRALGLVVDLGTANRDLATVVLQRLGEPERIVDAATCLRAWALLGECADLDVDPPTLVRVLDGSGSRVVPPAQAVVCADPRWLQRSDLGGLVVVAADRAGDLAGLLDLPLSSELADGAVVADGTVADVPPEVATLVPDAPGQWCEHDELRVDGVAVSWWVDRAGVHAATTDGLARGLCFAAGAWAARHAVAHLLTEPGDAVRLATEDAAGQPVAALPRPRRT